MKRTIFLSVSVLISLSALRAQQVITFSGDGSGRSVGSGVVGMVTEKKQIGTAELECFYDYRFSKDTADLSTGFSQETMVLQVGSGLSRFYSYLTMKADSLLATVSSPDEVLADISKFRSGENFNVYKNYPAGKLTYTDKIGNGWYIYEEDYTPQQWHLHGKTREIEGYECRMATCSFRGRNYTAWYTPEIPLGEGPWKFSGLPGLILEVSDDAGHYRFTLSGLQQADNSPIYIAETNCHMIARRQSLQAAETYHVDPIGFMAISGVEIKIMNQDGTPHEMMKPAPMKYDLMERDYK
ncbi:MAG: GLPGLI family protein [Rikenellaceae bacterium]|nr:GLPGLI family protein [Rikenellaceae bacterium]